MYNVQSCEGTYVVEGDLLVVPAKRRRYTRLMHACSALIAGDQRLGRGGHEDEPWRKGHLAHHVRLWLRQVIERPISWGRRVPACSCLRTIGADVCVLGLSEWPCWRCSH